MSGKRIIAILLAIFVMCSMPAVAKAKHSDWASADITEAIELGFAESLISQDCTQNITRAEFARTSVEFMNIINGENYLHGEAVFSDTDDVHINTAYHLGIIGGRGDGTFAPDELITREEAAKMVANTYRACLKTDALVGTELSFEDSSEIADWAYNDISILCRSNIIYGTDGNMFEPRASYTREQCVVTFMRLYRLIQSNNASPSFDGKNPDITDFLKVSEGSLISGGKEVVLNGVNLGGWLILETWMSPIADENEDMAYSDVLKIFKKRFGQSRTDALIDSYETNFIREQDFENIEKLGFNCVRIPFWYRNFMTEDGRWTGDGFKRLDWAIEQCEKRGIWVILDMHGCPGGQSMNHSTGIKGSNGLYSSKTNLERMEKIWTKIAERYKDIKCIAAYDIMNEPQNNKGYTGYRAWQAESETAVRLTNEVYEQMISAIRRIDKNHIVTVEGIWTMNVLPNPDDYGWENMMYQLHIYDNAQANIDLRIGEFVAAREKWGVAPLSGEYNSGELEEYAADLYDKHNISRIKWTYKTVRNYSDNWGLYNKEYKKLDINTASFEEIMTAFKTDVKTESFVLNVSEYNKIK